MDPWSGVVELMVNLGEYQVGDEKGEEESI
jgi:hypothetical protein